MKPGEVMCIVSGCKEPSKAKKLCQRHYRAQLEGRDVFKTKSEKAKNKFMDPKLFVAIVCRNRLDYTRRTIESLMKTVPTAEFHIFDNASDEPGMQDYLRSLANAPINATIVLSDKNVGWGAAHEYQREQYLQKEADKRSEYVLFSDNDVVYQDGWFEKTVALFEKYPLIGVFGVWKHIYHGVKQDLGDLIVKDQMPGVGWVVKRENIEKLGAIPARGTYETKGGIGEDVTYCINCENNGLWVCGPKEDFAEHLTGY